MAAAAASVDWQRLDGNSEREAGNTTRGSKDCYDCRGQMRRAGEIRGKYLSER